MIRAKHNTAPVRQRVTSHIGSPKNCRVALILTELAERSIGIGKLAEVVAEAGVRLRRAPPCRER